MKEKIPFWLDDFNILYNNDNYLQFYPKKNTSRNEQLNSITRFFLYMMIIFYAFDLEEKYIYIPFSFIVATSLIYCSNNNSKSKNIKNKSKKDKNLKNNQNKIYNYDKNINYSINEQKNLQVKSKDVKNDIIKNDIIKNDIIKNDNKNPQPINIDKLVLNELEINKDFLITNQFSNKENIIENMTDNLNVDSYELDIDFDNFIKPTINNPYMNPTLYDNENMIDMIDETDIKNEINKNFEHNLFLDFEDAFKNRNSQRQFYTIPGSRLPPDQMKFARWLYNDDTSCKLNTADCMPYPRYKRVRIGNQL